MKDALIESEIITPRDEDVLPKDEEIVHDFIDSEIYEKPEIDEDVSASNLDTVLPEGELENLPPIIPVEEIAFEAQDEINSEDSDIPTFEKIHELSSDFVDTPETEIATDNERSTKEILDNESVFVIEGDTADADEDKEETNTANSEVIPANLFKGITDEVCEFEDDVFIDESGEVVDMGAKDDVLLNAAKENASKDELLKRNNEDSKSLLDEAPVINADSIDIDEADPG